MNKLDEKCEDFLARENVAWERFFANNYEFFKENREFAKDNVLYMARNFGVCLTEGAGFTEEEAAALRGEIGAYYGKFVVKNTLNTSYGVPMDAGEFKDAVREGIRLGEGMSAREKGKTDFFRKLLFNAEYSKTEHGECLIGD